MGRMSKRYLLPEEYEEIKQEIIDSLTLCTDKDCDNGVSLIPGTADTRACPVCNGRGFVIG